jgi:hypothetical protein
MRKTYILLLALTALATSTASAQRLGVSVGYTRIPGRIGNVNSNEGIGLRLGVELNPRSIFRVAFEAGVDRLNEDRRFFQSSCLHPAGGTATCNFDSRERDTGLSLSAILRAGPNTGSVRPYALLGLQAMEIRTRSRSVVTDSTGAHLTNFEFDGTSTDASIGVPLGGGVLFRPGGSPIGIGIEARVTPMLHNYSGGLMIEWSPGLALTVRL